MIFLCQHINGHLVLWLTMVNFVAGITLTVSPSPNVEVNQTVTLRCTLDPNPNIPVVVIFSVIFRNQMNILCVLEPYNGTCKNTTASCSTLFNASCLNGTVFSVHVNVPKSWNGTSIRCETFIATSNTINFSVIVPVTSVTITPTSITVIDGQQINVTCTTSYCDPPADITWYKSTTRTTSQSTSSKDSSDGFRTTSLLQSQVGKLDNGQQLYCKANNTRGRSVNSMVLTLTVLYKPEVTSSNANPYRIIEGQNAALECRVTAANPNSSITWRWYNANNPNNVIHNGLTLIILNTQRNRSGLYGCTASNSIGTSLAVNTYLDVQYKPEILDKPSTIVNLNERVILTRTIVSNPLADVYWFGGLKLLFSQFSVKNATFIKEKALCTDTKNFTLVADNKIERNVTAFVELIVNCKPMVDDKNITFGVTGTTGLYFSTIVIAYPAPQYELKYEKGTRNNQMMETITRNAVNNFTINFYQKTVKDSDYGTYHLIIWNLYGSTTVIVNIFKQTETTNSQTGAIAGSVAGTLVLTMIVFVIVFLVHKRYTCNITIQNRKSKGMNESSKDTSLYATITEQQENSERHMYDGLTGTEGARHYEAVLMKEKQGNNEKLYEELQKSQSDGYDGQIDSIEPKKQSQSSMDDRSMKEAIEEYANTSFIM